MAGRVSILDGVLAVLGAALVIVFVRYELRWPWLVAVVLAPFGAIGGYLLSRARAMV